MISIEYLDDERKKVWLEINQLKEDVDKKSSDHEKDAKQASKKCSEYRNKSLSSRDAISEALIDAESKIQSIQSHYVQIETELTKVGEIANTVKENEHEINSVLSKSEMISELFENQEDLREKLESLTGILEQGQDSSNKINTIYNAIMKRKGEFDELFYEINGYEETDPSNGDTIHISGLKDDLEIAFKDISNSIDALKKDILKINSDASNTYHQFIESEKKEFKIEANAWKEEYLQLTQKVKNLLPDALTAGLSHAFSEKRHDEIKSGEALSRTFYLAILGLVLVSLLPFSINIVLLNQGKSLEVLIYDMPRMVIAILPLYIPFLWLAYSSNKKANLSKRLVEEYTHKEVLSKTYEGLSSQIDGLQNQEASAELRTKLLFNILEVSSENPGKLISDYNKADHPLMDALDKSSKLSDAVNSLAKIPGFSKLASLLDKRSNEILQKQTVKITEALDVISESEIKKDVIV